jgi:hypothetical protein
VKPPDVVAGKRREALEATRMRLGNAARAERDAYLHMRAMVRERGPAHPEADAAVTAWLETRKAFVAQQIAEGRACEHLLVAIRDWRRDAMPAPTITEGA